MKISMLAVPLSIFVVFSLLSSAQWKQQPTTGSTPMRLPDRTMYTGMSGIGPQLDAELVDKDKNAKEKRAVVKVDVWGMDLVAPHPGAEPKRSEAYLIYQLDQQTQIMTAEKEHTFDNLSAGEHKIRVQLAHANGHPAGAPVILSLKIG